ncbi:MAG: AAA family ATPase [Nanobdellota archaeon]
MVDKNIEAQDNDYNYGYNTNNSHLEMENKILRETVGQLQEEVEKYQEPALMVCEVSEVRGENAVIRVPNGNQFFVNISSNVKNLKPGESVLCEQKNLTIVKKSGAAKKFDVEKYIIEEKPNVKWKDIGGLKKSVQEVHEVVEMPLTKPKLFTDVGIEPPKGILLHGPPGTGKTLLAKAVANATNSTFLEIVGSELVQKFIGEGSKMIKELFDMARKKQPTIIFIDELDAIAAKRIEVGTSGEREVQRTFMQLLAEIDGFEPLSNVKIIGCTNRIDILDPAIVRPGRLDRLIEVEKPDAEGIEQIFKIHSKKMKLDSSLKNSKKSLFKKMEGFSGSEIKSVCTEAGYFAIRNNRTSIKKSDIVKAIEKVSKVDSSEKNYQTMFS